ncbi:MAG TPA: MlaD family protein [Burkholderiales bacterium]|nr:MlaD family protein [Burkholderiales bacterium]
MESRAYALVTGLFVLGIAACIVLWANWLAKEPVERAHYRVVSTVDVSGLNPEAQVRYRGMSVGRVKAISLDPKDPRRILVDIEVDRNIPVTRDTYAQLGMEGITGIAYVHLMDDYKDMRPAERGPGGVAELPLRPSFIDTLSDSAQATVRDTQELMANVNALLTPENRRRVGATLASLERVSGNLEQVTAHLPQTLARADAWLSDDNRRLAHRTLERVDEAAKSLPQIAREAESLTKDARALVAQVGRLSAEAQATAGGLRDETLPRVNALADSVERSAQRVGRLALQLDRDPQSPLFGRKPGRPGPGEPGFQ